MKKRRRQRKLEVKKRSSRTVTVVRFPIGEERVDTECAESAFERRYSESRREFGGAKEVEEPV
jgi:hypothetical protein